MQSERKRREKKVLKQPLNKLMQKGKVSILTSLTTCCDCTTGLIVSIAKKVVLKCSAMLQKETVDKLIDEACGDVVKDGHAGLCE